MATYVADNVSIHPRAEIDADVEIGPFCVIGPNVRIGRGTRLENNVTLMGRVTLGQYKTMELGEEFARSDIDSCAALALKLGRDADYRADAEARVRVAAPKLFDEAAASDAFQRFLLFAAPRDIG